MAESFVKQLKSCIQKQVESNGTDWDLFLHTTAFAVRSNMAYNTNFSPAKLVIGSKLVQPIGEVMNNIPKSYSEKQAHAFATDLKRKLRQSNEIVNNQLKLSRTKTKLQYDKSSKPRVFDISDTVMLWKPYKKKNLSRCFQPNWDGPWVIQRFLHESNSNCTIISADGNKTLNVHVNQLKLIRPRSVTFQPTIQRCDSRTIPNTRNVNGHYLENFEDSDNDLDNGLDNGLDADEYMIVRNIPEHRHHQIDNRWVDLNSDNVIPNRTRGVSIDYKELVGND